MSQGGLFLAKAITLMLILVFFIMHKPMSSLIKITGLAFIILILNSCSFTSTYQKKVDFKVDVQTVEKQMNDIMKFEHINVNGLERTRDGNKENILQVEIKNGENLPTDNTALKALGKKIASIIKQDVANADGYDSFTIVFIHEHSSGVLTKKTTNAFSYKKGEF